MTLSLEIALELREPRPLLVDHGESSSLVGVGLFLRPRRASLTLHVQPRMQIPEHQESVIERVAAMIWYVPCAPKTSSVTFAEP